MDFCIFFAPSCPPTIHCTPPEEDSIAGKGNVPPSSVEICDLRTDQEGEEVHVLGPEGK